MTGVLQEDRGQRPGFPRISEVLLPSFAARSWQGRATWRWRTIRVCTYQDAVELRLLLEGLQSPSE